MRNFASVAEFVEYLETRMEAVRLAQKEGLNAAGHMLVHEAQATIGHYQEAAGPFKAWSPLSDATLYGGVSSEGHKFPGKVELGYAPPDNPLLRTGHMRGSIECEAAQNHVVLGTHDPIAFWQEFGDYKIPARSFIGATMFKHGHAAAELIFEFVMCAVGGLPKPRPPSEHSESED